MVPIRFPARRARRGCPASGLVLLLLAALVALSPRPVVAQAADADAAVRMLLEKLEERDAVIRDLQRRVAQLESRVGPTSAPAAPSAPTPAQPPPPAAEAAVAGRGPASAPAAPQPSRRQEAEPEVAAAEAAPPPSGPGQFEVDEEAADRALERTLVQQGVLLLPVGFAEVQPSFVYTRDETDRAPVLREVEQTGESVVVARAVRRNEFRGDLQLRFGLPYDSQFEFGVPYRHVGQSDVSTYEFRQAQMGAESDSGSGSGFGDVRIGLAKTLLREKGVMPDLVGRLTWDTATGKVADGDVELGGGFNELIGSLSVLKRQDPLAFSASLSYEKSFEKDGVDPGDLFGVSIGAALAASPATSLQLALRQSFVDEFQVNGRSIEGSDRVLGQLVLGASSIIGGRSLLSLSASFGLTDDAADYSVGLSYSRRFDIPDLKLGGQ